MTPRRHARGFTLIEVLVALMIVGLGMGAVLSALTSSADSTQRLREKSFAEWIGFNQLSLVRLKQGLPATGRSEGDLEFANSKWHWQQEVEAMEIPGVLRILVHVRHADTPGNDANKKADSDWLATVAGFRGDALNTGQGTMPGLDAPAARGKESGPAPGQPPAPAPAPGGAVER